MENSAHEAPHIHVVVEGGETWGRDYAPYPTTSLSWYDRLQAWEDKNSLVVYVLIGAVVILGYVAVCAAGTPDGFQAVMGGLP
ncbi:MAG: hypothetical protein RLZZ70_255 [Candidatus Parcubacteria bacterium]|jgi:hypothetical protein